MSISYRTLDFCGLRLALLASTCVAGCLSWAGDAQAQAAAVSEIEELVVTARKREETLLEVPAAISAISSTDLARANATDLTSISRLVPQLRITQAGSGSGGGMSMRGIGSSASDAGLESEVLIVIDGIPTSRGWVTQSSFFDVANVQVLKGPQALFFGKNSPAGVVSITSASATDTWQGFARAGYEFVAEERWVEAAIGGPLTETLGIRLAARYNGIEGWMRNVAPPIANNPLDPRFPLPGATTNKTAPNDDKIAARLTLNWEPTDNFRAELKAAVSKLESVSGLTGTGQIVACAPGRPGPTTAGVVDPFMDCKADRRTSQSAIPFVLASSWSRMESVDPFVKNRTGLFSLELEYDLGPVTLTSITGHTRFRVNGSGNFDNSSFVQIPSVVGEDAFATSEELRAATNFGGPVNFLVGIYLERQKINDWNIARITPGLPPHPSGLNQEYFSDNFQTTTTVSPFFQVTWDILDNLELAGGARYTREEKNAALGNRFTNGPVYRPAGDYLLGRFEDTDWSPEATLTWRPTPTSTLFAAYRTGYKSGGFSITGVLIRGGTIDPLTYGSEESEGFDLGYRSELLDGRLFFDAVIYRYKYNDLQRTVLDIPTTTFIIQNAAVARVQGVEVSSRFQVTPELLLHADVAYNEAKYTSYPDAPCYAGQTLDQGCTGVGRARVQDLSGTRIPGASDWEATVGFRYERPITSSWSVGLDGSLDYNSGYDSANPVGGQDAFHRLHAGVRLFQPDGHWSVELIGRNITNEYISLGGGDKVFGAPGDLSGSIERPRQVILQVNYRY